MGLKWSDLDWLGGAIQVKRGWVQGKESRLKTSASKAAVPMVPALAEKLKTYRQETKYSQPGDWVFPSIVESGRIPMYASTFVADYVRPAAKKAGVVIPDGHRFGLQNLRAGLATFIVSVDKADPKTAQGLLRHRKVEMTLSKYAQVVSAEVAAAQQRFIQAMEGSAETSTETAGSSTSTDTPESQTGKSLQ